MVSPATSCATLLFLLLHGTVVSKYGFRLGWVLEVLQLKLPFYWIWCASYQFQWCTYSILRDLAGDLLRMTERRFHIWWGPITCSQVWVVNVWKFNNLLILDVEWCIDFLYLVTIDPPSPSSAAKQFDGFEMNLNQAQSEVFPQMILVEINWLYRPRWRV